MATPYDDGGAAERARAWLATLREQEYQELVRRAQEWRSQAGAADPRFHLVSLSDYSAGLPARPIPLVAQAADIRAILGNPSDSDDEITRTRRNLAIQALREFATRLLLEDVPEEYVRAISDIAVANSLDNIEEDPRY
ncbi:hypothetical protein I6A84_43010 [Frankia sp. CNm7]|uniref:Uncharacterized protein n=1 Tax=Frankia nepalensis TaxID=1836974 RepID=A0A937UPC4_9ACTN|nr:hypothetical protein [Frankia nepalensis]MBL7499543.1 hypothetical protein [Frankia nepalensis]MBL7515622.1 hypothetical protein [Frankia nepalensis]MBL7524635.1 hypothetical protein [Frankia nepalensis]MBL7630719.1 hypothetical protein [Frankia nepalensis]